MYNVIRTRKNKLFIHLKFLTNYICKYINIFTYIYIYIIKI